MYVVTIYLCKNSITHVLADTPQQSIQSCTPLVNKQFAPGRHSDLMPGWRHIEIRTKYANEVFYNGAITSVSAFILVLVVSSVHTQDKR